MTSIVLLLAFGGSVLAFEGGGAVPAPAGGLARLGVSFKLDPRLTRGLYMGDRWVSPPTYAPGAQEGTRFTVEARAYGIDAKGRPFRISPKWLPADPGMVTVTPGEGTEVKITVERAGESRLQVSSHGLSSELTLKATYQGSAIRVEISQKQ